MYRRSSEMLLLMDSNIFAKEIFTLWMKNIPPALLSKLMYRALNGQYMKEVDRFLYNQRTTKMKRTFLRDSSRKLLHPRSLQHP